MKRNRRGGFTLIEVLIVVVIMAVLAATIIPQFTDSTEDAKRSQAQFNEHTLRAQIQLYKVQHGGALPAAANLASELTKKTTYNGVEYGPYIDQMPTNPINNKNNVLETSATAATPPSFTEANGWLYNPNTGMIWADVKPVNPPDDGT
jgi:prepilin-type N-terminal cleavage/methylation domain-containing protein